MKVLVTGGAGFIGSHIVDRLVKDGAKVRVLDNFSAGRMENLELSIKKINLIKGDIRDVTTVRQAAKGMNYIIHEAAKKSVPESLKKPEEFNDVNVNGTLNILNQAYQAGVKRVVFASSSSIYGDVKVMPQKESLGFNPISPYGATKAIGEIYCQTFAKIHRTQTIMLRYFNVFGPRQEPDSPYAGVIILFITALLKNKQPIIFGDGKQSRDFTYVDNVAVATISCLKAPASANGMAFNIAASQPITVLQLVNSLNKILGKNIKPIFKPIRQGDIKHSYADNTLARWYLKYKTLVTLKQGLEKTMEYFS